VTDGFGAALCVGFGDAVRRCPAGDVGLAADARLAVDCGLACGDEVSTGEVVGDGLPVGEPLGDGLPLGEVLGDGLALAVGLGVAVGRAVGGTRTALGLQLGVPEGCELTPGPGTPPPCEPGPVELFAAGVPTRIECGPALLLADGAMTCGNAVTAQEPATTTSRTMASAPAGRSQPYRPEPPGFGRKLSSAAASIGRSLAAAVSSSRSGAAPKRSA